MQTAHCLLHDARCQRCTLDARASPRKRSVGGFQIRIREGFEFSIRKSWEFREFLEGIRYKRNGLIRLIMKFCLSDSEN